MVYLRQGFVVGIMRGRAIKVLLVVVAVGVAGGALRAQSAPEADANGTASVSPQIEACATDKDKLGLSRVVEIDETGGPEFGGSSGGHNNFLKDHEVVLTFDDGPLRPYTRPVLKALAAHCTKATFFMVGRMAVADPVMVKEVAAAGHTIGSHTWSHMNLKPLGLLKGRNEVEGGLSAVTKARGGPIAPFFRFPFLSISRQVVQYAKSRNIAIFQVDIDSKDYMTRDPKVVHNKVISQLLAQRKGIILMHDIQPSTAGAIRGLLDELHKRGFKVVHMVPRTPAATIASFDTIAGKAFAAKAAAKGAKPLAERSMVWTAAPPGKSAAGAAPAARRATTANSQDETLPWSKPDTKKQAENRPAKPAQPREELPWQMRIFNY